MPLTTPENAPLYEIKSNLFKALAHPARIRVLELLVAAGDEEVPVSALLEATGLEASHLSQHLAVLRKHGVVSAQRSGNAVNYRLAHPAVAELLTSARKFLTEVLGQQRDQLVAVAELPSLEPR